ncbi:unnamed protein product [Brachionus calyciflorus]|uniref:FLYWCH-type domain-containing protein n=1 Tax=Brachionus calyciflorus TaxID=104777 RepID=A0A814E3C0_9BILA|nr:unnamed protein product [Brachionus calyciflorus]
MSQFLADFNSRCNFLSPIDFDVNDEELMTKMISLILISFTHKNVYKLFPSFYAYNKDKTKLSEVKGAAKIYWKCSSLECKARITNIHLKLIDSDID